MADQKNDLDRKDKKMNVAEPRQTSLSLQNLIECLGCSQVGYPRCLIISEIGVACFNSEDSDSKGEEVLLSLLNNEALADRLLAFMWISCIPDMAEKNSSILREFRDKAENQSYLNEMDEKITVFKQRTS